LALALSCASTHCGMNKTDKIEMAAATQ